MKVNKGPSRQALEDASHHVFLGFMADFTQCRSAGLWKLYHVNEMQVYHRMATREGTQSIMKISP